MTAVLLLAIGSAVLLIRAGWSGPRQLSDLGWLLGGATLIALTWRDGAWGLSIGLVTASLAALLIVTYAGAISPAKPVRQPPSVPLRTIRLLWTDVGRRVAVFAIVVVGSFLASQWLAVAIAAGMKGDGALDANAVSTAMFVQPTVWAVLMAWQMTMPRAAQMIFPPLLVGVTGTLIWLLA